MNAPVTTAELDAFYGTPVADRPLSQGVQATINSIRAIRQLFPHDTAQILMALSCQIHQDLNAHIHADYVDEIDKLALYIQDEHI